MKRIKNQFELSDFLLENLNKEHIDSSGKLVLLAIAHHSNSSHNWQAFPSTERIEELTCLGRTAVFDALKRLKQSGIVEYIKGRTGKSNRYTINLQVVSSLTGIDVEYSKPPKKLVAKEVQIDYDGLIETLDEEPF